MTDDALAMNDPVRGRGGCRLKPALRVPEDSRKISMYWQSAGLARWRRVAKPERTAVSRTYISAGGAGTRRVRACVSVRAANRRESVRSPDRLPNPGNVICARPTGLQESAFIGPVGRAGFPLAELVS